MRFVGPICGALGAAVLALACNQRFEFDVPSSAGGAGANSNASGGNVNTNSTSGLVGGSTGQIDIATGGSDDGGGDHADATGGSSRIGSTLGTGSAGGPSTSACAANCAAIGLKCASDWRTCVECNADTDCGTSRPYCGTKGPLAHRCLECNGATCPWGSSCDSLSGRCIRACHVEDDGAVDDHFCQNGTTCSSSTGFCAECETDANCAGSSSGSYCAASSRQCVGCTSDAQCTTAARHCDPALSTCVACRDSRDCPSGMCDATSHQCR